LYTGRNKEQIEVRECLLSYGAEYFVFHFCYPKIIKVKIYRTTIFSVILCGRETWSITLREGRRLRVYENRVLRRIFGPKRDEVTGEWRNLHNEELNDQYSSPNIVRVVKSRRIRWGGTCSTYEESMGLYRILMGKPKGKRPMGRHRHRWEDNINTGLQEVGCEGMDWIDVAQHRDRWRALGMRY